MSQILLQGNLTWESESQQHQYRDKSCKVQRELHMYGELRLMSIKQQLGREVAAVHTEML